MGRKQADRTGGDLRDYPRYSTREAAGYLGIPESTLKEWIRAYSRRRNYGSPRQYDGIIQIADPQRGLLSFLNLAEAHILRATRQRNVPLDSVRSAIEYIRERNPGEPHPLLRPDFATHGKSVFIRELGLSIDASKHGQTVMKSIIDRHLQRIKRAPDGLPEELTPMYSKKIAINPRFSSGQPIVAGTGIMVSILAARRAAGESLRELATDYGIKPYTIDRAIKDFAAAA